MNKFVWEGRAPVYICSPFAGDEDGNVQRAIRYCRYAYLLGYIPIAPHLYLPRFLDDQDTEERRFGLRLGIALLQICKEMWVFGKTISIGMQAEIEKAEKHSIPIRYFSEEDISI